MIGGFQVGAFQLAYQQEVRQSTGAGRKRKKRYFVQIDGQDFEVRSAEDARALLQQAVALADRAAQKQVAKAVNVPRGTSSAKVAPVAVAAPQIRTNAPIDLEPYRRAIEQVYRNAAIAAELAMLLEAQARDDDESAAYLLLH